MGSNIEPRLDYLRNALMELNKDPLELVAVSNLFETGAVDVEDQDDFLNMVALVDTEMSPTALLARLQSIEARAGKKIERRRGPRTLDLDLVLLGNEIVDSENLTLPHPRMQDRAFVLKPLLQVAPGAKHPASGVSVKDMLKNLPEGQKIKDLGPIPLEQD